MKDVGSKTIRVVAAVIERMVEGERRYLITQRRESAVLPLLWEFPGGRCEHGETDERALKREMRERLDADVSVGVLLSYLPHDYEHYTVELYLYQCDLLRGELVCKAVRDYRWVTSEEFDRYPFTPADEASMTKLLGEAS